MSTTSHPSPHDPTAVLPDGASLFGEMAELSASVRATRLRVLDLDSSCGV